MNIDEKFAATLYLHGVQCAYSNKSALHQAVLLFLSESNYLLGCLYTIISTPGQEDYDLNVRELFQAFVSELVEGLVDQGVRTLEAVVRRNKRDRSRSRSRGGSKENKEKKKK